jgi:hypothetical protein
MSNNWDFQQAQQMGQLWMEMCAKMGSMMTAAQPGSPPPEAARQVRAAAFKNMTEQAEQFMRSEQFLQGMKLYLDRTLESQKQYQAFMTNLRHATEGVAAQDVQAVMVLMRQMESRVLDRLEEVTNQLNRLSDRLDEWDAKASEQIDPGSNDEGDLIGATRAKRNGEEGPQQGQP